MHRSFGTLAAAGVMAAILFATPASAGESATFTHGVASGDPRPDSVVLWTRAVDPSDAEADVPVVLQVATDGDFTNVVVTRELVALEEYDHCVKVKVTGLDPGTAYHYRFGVAVDGDMEWTIPGVTRTAPDPEADEVVRFAVAYGQDYAGRYYNSYLQLLRDHPDDLDFIVHLGDFVYETTGDPTFQDPSDERKVVFEDVEGAIQLGDPENPYYAAASLANYRTLYRTFLSDPVLRDVRRQYPFVVIWDDHEYSDDSWGDVATYFDGRKDEADPERRRNAERAWMEWVPSEAGLGEDGTLEIGEGDLCPNSKIYRNLRFGANLELLMTDYRTYRPDHLIPESAFPGAVAVDEATLRQMLGDEMFEQVAPHLDAYVDLQDLGLDVLTHTAYLIASQVILMANPGMDLKTAIKEAEALLADRVSATYVNMLFAAAGYDPPFPPDTMARLERGITYLYLGKTSEFSSLGSRYMVMRDPFTLYAGARFMATEGASENALGDAQMAWLAQALGTSTARWNVVASSVSMAPMILDFTNPAIAPTLPEGFPDSLRTRINLNVDQWEGFPNMRDILLDMFRQTGNTVVISGDIHASFVADHGGVYEFTAPAISSESLQELVTSTVKNDPVLGEIPGLEQLLSQLSPIFMVSASDPDVTPSSLLYAETLSSGYAAFEVGPDAINVLYRLYPSEMVGTSFYEDPEGLEEVMQTVGFVLQDGTVTPLSSD